MKRLVPVILLLALTTVAAACPFCKDAVANSGADSIIGGAAPPGSDLSAGFNSSIYYMLGGLFAVCGVFGFKMYKVIRQSTIPAGPKGPPSV